MRGTHECKFDNKLSLRLTLYLLFLSLDNPVPIVTRWYLDGTQMVPRGYPMVLGPGLAELRSGFRLFEADRSPFN